MRMSWLLLGVALSAVPTTSLGQEKAAAAAPARPAPLQRLQFLEGRWKFTGVYLPLTAREKIDEVTRCEWRNRFLICTEETDLGGMQMFSYNDDTQRFEGVYAQGNGDFVPHLFHWDEGRLISEYELFVDGKLRHARRTITPGPDANSWRWIVQDLGDPKQLVVVVDITATRLPN